MPKHTVVNGDILDAPEQTILQQCNCLATRPHGLSKTIAEAYPWANVYGERKEIPGIPNVAIEKDRRVLGTLKIMSSPDDTKRVVCAFAQWKPGNAHRPPRYVKWARASKGINDGPQERLVAFKKCLEKIESNLTIPEIAIPWMIGCGLAGGNWKDYKEAIEETLVDTRVVFYKKK